MKRFLRHLNAYDIACFLLAVWACGLLVAAVQLDGWRRELTRTLVQLNADAQFRTQLARHRDAVDPEWYRRKALQLLAATERLHNDAWTVFVPGSWRAFDDLEERLAARINREFGDIVVETIRRELYARAAQLTGTPMQAGSREFAAGAECTAPQPAAAPRRLSAAPEDLAEYVAVRDYLRKLEQLDQAVQAFLALQRSRTADPQQLRHLVRYTLGAELPVSVSRSIPLFRDAQEVPLQPVLMQSALGWAARCSLVKGMGALYKRLLAGNDLFALEEALRRNSLGLFEPHARPVPFDRTLERYRAVLTLLHDQDKLLSQGRNGWMRQGTLRLGSAHDDLLARVERTQLLGPSVVSELQSQSGLAFAEFRRQFEALFGTGRDAGIVWIASQERFGHTPERVALREGLAQLLEQPFMQESLSPSRRKDVPPFELAEAEGWLQARDGFVQGVLQRVPEPARAAVARVVDSRVADLVYQRAFRALKAPFEPDVPFDTVAYRRQGENVLKAQALLERVGARGLSARLAALHAEPLLKRLGALEAQWQQLALYQPDAGDFAWWQGDVAPLWQPFGAADAAGLQKSLGDQVARLEALNQQALVLLQAAEPELAPDPQVKRWKQLAGELDRWRARKPDSSLVALERYLVATGPDLRRDNCAERLSSQQPPRKDDEVSLRYAQLHGALAARCAQLTAGL
jgi:type VI secretion system protein ImpL